MGIILKVFEGRGVMSNNRHRWSFEEDAYCSEICVEYFVLKKSDISVGALIEELSDRFPCILPNSLKMKVQNIKQILDEEGIENSLNVRPLSNYSQQNRRAMDTVLKKHGLA